MRPRSRRNSASARLDSAFSDCAEVLRRPQVRQGTVLPGLLAIGGRQSIDISSENACVTPRTVIPPVLPYIASINNATGRPVGFHQEDAMTTRTTLRKIGFALAVASSLFSMSTASHAYTMEEERLCMDDAFKFCGSDIPNVDKITICMRAHKAQLSPGCKSVMHK